MPVYTHSVLEVYDSYVTVYNDAISRNLQVYLPDIISKRPQVGDSIVYLRDDVDYNYGSFIRYNNADTVVPASNKHIHYMMSDEKVAELAEQIYPDDTSKRNELMHKLLDLSTGEVKDE